MTNATLEDPGTREVALSVIVPARNCPSFLESCLTSLRASDIDGYEIIVVDDASTDDTGDVARQMGATVLRTKKQSGPGAARNLGAAHARAPYLFFVDADVCVHPHTLRRVLATFREDARVDAFFGSYDPEPPAKNFLSQYRNLHHHFVHQDGNPEASTFWAGCGAIKRDVFVAASGFDESYGRPSIEDNELGTRLHKAGYRVRLVADLQVTHLKRWTLWSMVVADVRDRAIPWTQLILREGQVPNDLNLKLRHRICAVLSYLALASTLASPVLLAAGRRSIAAATLAAAALLVAAIVALNARFYLFFARERSALFALMAIPVHVAYYLYSGAAFATVLLHHAWKSVVAREDAKATGR
ncbi:MAG: glycosyltransferase family 2 protein [Acidobacteriota bacterium]